jgi:hypothetical protein
MRPTACPALRRKRGTTSIPYTETRTRVGRHQVSQRQKRACGFGVVIRHMRAQAKRSWHRDAAARVAGFGSLSLLRYAGSGLWDRGLGRSITGGSWGAVVDSCRGAWMFQAVDLRSDVAAEVRKGRECRRYLSMPGYVGCFVVVLQHQVSKRPSAWSWRSC